MSGVGRLLTVSLALILVSSQCEDSQVREGFFYNCQVEGSSFFEDVPVGISAKQQGVAGLPEWLTVGQFNSSSPAFIYGTPTEQGAIILQITGRNEITFESITVEVDITIIPTEGNVLQEHELYITSFELLEFLTTDVQSLFQTTLSQAYQSVSNAVPAIRSVSHPSSQGFPAPVLPAKHGVIVSVTPGEDVELPTDTCGSTFTQVFMSNGFTVDSCTAMSLSLPPSSPSTEPLDVGRSPPPSRGSSLSLIIFVVVGAVIVFMSVTGLACILCGMRKNGYTVSRTKKQRETVMHDFSKATSRGPVSARTHLRDLAKPVPQPTAGDQGRPVSVTSGEPLMFQDLTDYSNHDSNSTASSQPPPPYTYPNISYTTTSSSVRTA